MIPTEKAKELIDEFYQTTPNEAWINEPLGVSEEYKAWKQAAQCALIAVKEILRSEPRSPSNVDWDDVGGTHQYYYEAQREEADKYWQEVKQELEKIRDN